MSDVVLCAVCNKGLRPGQTDSWQEFTALERVGKGAKGKRVVGKTFTGKVLCASCALPGPQASLFDAEPLPGATG